MLKKSFVYTCDLCGQNVPLDDDKFLPAGFIEVGIVHINKSRKVWHMCNDCQTYITEAIKE